MYPKGLVQSYAISAPNTASPGATPDPNIGWSLEGKEALHSSMRPEHRRQPRHRPEVVGGHWWMRRTPEGDKSTLPGCGQERQLQGPASGSKQKKREKRRVKTSRPLACPLSKSSGPMD